jgi:hypothetical protein
VSAGVDTLLELLEASETLYAARVRADGVVLTANQALERWVGAPLAGGELTALVTGPQRPVLQRAVEDATAEWTSLTVGFSNGSPRPADDRRVLLRRDGDAVLVVAEPALAQRDRLVEQVLELNQDLIGTQRSLSRRQRELERAQADADAAMDRVRRLESIMLAGLTRPDLEGVLQALLEIARDVFGCDDAAVLLRHQDRRHLYVAAAIGIEEGAATAMQVPIGRGFAGRIAASGNARTIADVADSDVYSSYLRQRGGSLAGVPLVLDGAVIGVLHVSARQAGRFTGEDLALLERVGERAALAIGHAQLRDRERAVAETLQRSMLPEELPVVPGIALAARYLSRAEGIHVGGDFYDAFVLGGVELGLSIGDVAGKGLQAASSMGRLRNAMRAYAFEGVGPAELLSRLDRLMADEEGMATAQHFAMDPVTGRVRHSNAGHPPALRLSAAGDPEWVEGALAPPLGTSWTPRVDADLVLAPGDRLLLFTDGLVERRDAVLDDGLSALAEAASSAPAGDLEALCDHVLGCLSGAAGGFEDDVAMLACERVRPPA